MKNIIAGNRENDDNMHFLRFLHSLEIFMCKSLSAIELMSDFRLQILSFGHVLIMCSRVKEKGPLKKLLKIVEKVFYPFTIL